MPPNRISIDVRADHAELRLDQVLAAEIPELSRRKARTLIDIGGVFIDGKRVKVASRKLHLGQQIQVTLGAALREASPVLGTAARADDGARFPRHELVHEDDDVIVVFKPSGLHSVPTPESDRGNLVDQLQRRGDKLESVHVIHRLDLETSGLLVFAKHPSAARALERALGERRITREYIAVLAGVVPFTERRIDAPVAGKVAVSHFVLVEALGEVASHLRVRLETGRTHQIRIHASGIGHPVLGDRRYGQPTPSDPPTMALHAAKLAFPHPRNGEIMLHEAPLPSALGAWLGGLGTRAERLA